MLNISLELLLRIHPEGRLKLVLAACRQGFALIPVLLPTCC